MKKLVVLQNGKCHSYYPKGYKLIWLLSLHHIINKYLNYLFMIGDTSICNIYIIKFVITLVSLLQKFSCVIYWVNLILKNESCIDLRPMQNLVWQINLRLCLVGEGKRTEKKRKKRGWKTNRKSHLECKFSPYPFFLPIWEEIKKKKKKSRSGGKSRAPTGIPLFSPTKQRKWGISTPRFLSLFSPTKQTNPY